ncbi:HD domain-containing protein [Thiomonas sp.]
MRKQLLKSFLFVVLFWWTATTLWFSVTNPDVNLQALRRLAAFAPWLPLTVPKSASALNALSMQLQILHYWSLPMLGLTGLLSLTGAGLSMLFSWGRLKARAAREQAGAGGWRGLRITLGEIPRPQELPTVEADLEVESTPDPVLAQQLRDMAPGYRKLVQDVIKILAAHPEAYTGAGHGVSLLEHSVGVLEAALRRCSSETDPLLPIAAVAHDLGKITAFEPDGEGGWLRVKWHDKETARILATLPSWWSLEPGERQALLLAIKYDHSSGRMPFFPDSIRARALALQSALAGADRAVTAVEKENVLANHTLPELAVEAMMRALPILPLHVAGSAPPKGVKAAGWKKAGILYLLEHQCRERAMATLDEEVAAALGGNYRPQHKLARFTEELLKGLHQQGLLITEFNGGKVPPDEAMWVIISGTKEFKSVIALRITPEMALKLPEADTAYDITVTGSLKPRAPGELAATDVNLAGLLKKKKAPAAEAPEPPAAPADPPAGTAPQDEMSNEGVVLHYPGEIPAILAPVEPDPGPVWRSQEDLPPSTGSGASPAEVAEPREPTEALRGEPDALPPPESAVAPESVEAQAEPPASATGTRNERAKPRSATPVAEGTSGPAAGHAQKTPKAAPPKAPAKPEAPGNKTAGGFDFSAMLKTPKKRPVPREQSTD